MELDKFLILDLLEGYQKRQFKPSEVVAKYLGEIKKQNPKLNAFLHVNEEESLRRAKELDGKLGEVDKLPLFGVPIAIKDNFLVKGWRMTAGSKILGDYVAPYTATAVERLEAAGAICIGKTNLDEFAMGSSNENSAFGPVKNPFDLTRVPGGSSGGSAAAVSASLCPASLGTDTGGSIRQPASLCGVVGVKPTYGRVSRYGIVAFASSLDQVGPFAKNVWDAARVTEVMSGYDGKDATSSRAVVPKYTDALNRVSLKGTVIGVPRDWMEGLEGDVKKSFESSLELMKAEGAKVVDIKLPHAKYSLSVYYLLATSEASSNLARFDGVHYGHRTKTYDTMDSLYTRSRGEGFGREVKLRIMLGTYALSAGYYDAFYLKANKVRRQIQLDFAEAYKTVQCIVAPTSPSTAFKLGEKTDDPLTMYLSDVYTLPLNLAGLPGLSVPCGKDAQGLPIGLQFIGKHFDENTLFQVARGFESARGSFALPRWEA